MPILGNTMFKHLSILHCCSLSTVVARGDFLIPGVMYTLQQEVTDVIADLQISKSPIGPTNKSGEAL